MDRFHPNPAVAQLKEKLGHPVIDADGHLWEFQPLALEYIAKAGGRDILARYEQALRMGFTSRDWYGLSEAERRARWTHRTPFWGVPLRNRGLDVATSMFPDLLYQRLDEIGIDFTVLYPTMGLHPPTFADAETRRAVCRGLNDYYAEHWMGHPDRMTPVATIPMGTPAEAVEELEYVVRTKGFKVVMLPNWFKRPVKSIVERCPEAVRFAYRLDLFGIDSEYDYDIVWAKCRELGVIPTFHGTGEGSTFHDSISNTVFNHVGHFAAAATALCKALFLGGVPQRFPELRFQFLEGGVGWARTLLADLTGHWEKRNLKSLAEEVDPRRMDLDLYLELGRRYGGKILGGVPRETIARRWTVNPEDPTDSFARFGIQTKEELRKVFTERFYFGCEGDDPGTAAAFDTRMNPGRVKFKATLGSDIGHWDVPLMAQVLEETCEPWQKGLMSAADLKEFVFGNPAELFTSGNRDFFKGTVVERAVEQFLGTREE